VNKNKKIGTEPQRASQPQPEKNFFVFRSAVALFVHPLLLCTFAFACLISPGVRLAKMAFNSIKNGFFGPI